MFSAHATVWSDLRRSAEAAAPTGSGSSLFCHACGEPTGAWSETFHRNDDHADHSSENLVIVCPLCHLPQHLNRPTIDDESIVIWLPELTQRALTVLVRVSHLSLLEGDAFSEWISKGQLSRKTRGRSAVAAAETLAALRSRSEAARNLLGSARPSVLGAALFGLSAQDYAQKSELLGGLRLLPTGRLFAAGVDVYAKILLDWSQISQRGLSCS